MTTEEVAWTVIAGVALGIALFCWAKWANYQDDLLDG